MITNKCKEDRCAKEILKQISFFYQRHLKTIAVVHGKYNFSRTLITKELAEFTDW